MSDNPRKTEPDIRIKLLGVIDASGRGWLGISAVVFVFLVLILAKSVGLI